MADQFQVFMPDILAAQDLFRSKINSMQDSADAIQGIMSGVGGAPGGADSIDGVQRMLGALESLEADIAALPPDVDPNLGGIGGSHPIDDSPHGPGSGQGHGPGGNFPGGQQGGKGKDPKNNGGNSGGNSNAGGNQGQGNQGQGNQGQGNQGEGEDDDPANPTDGGTGSPPGQSGGTGPQQGPALPPDGGGTGAGAAAAGAGVFAIPGLQGKDKKNKDDEEELDEEELEEAPTYVSAANAPLKQELDEKTGLLGSAQENLKTIQSALNEKQDRLQRLEAAFAASHDAKLAERINSLRAEVAELNANLANDQALVDTLQVEVDALAKRWSYLELPPGANLEKIQALEGGKTSEWILNATRNEDNSVNCVNYVCNRMSIPGELPLNAHLWDDQATKFATELGIKVGDVPLEGSIIVMEREHSYGHDVYGHVMYVEKVENGIVWVTDNTYPDKMVRLDHLTDELSGPYIKYLYCPWQVVA